MRCIKVLMTVFILTISFSSFSQGEKRTHADSVSILKNIIKESATVSSSAVGFAGSPSRSWYGFAYLVSISIESELLAMTWDENPALRLYAYTGLVHKRYKNIDKVTQRLSRDKASVKTLSGCIMGTTTVNKALDNTGQWYHEEGITSFIDTLKKDKAYEGELFTALTLNKPIRRYVKE
jgi:hypothetical protein